MYKFDYFSPEIRLFYYGKNRIQTNFGGVLSIFIVIITGLLIFAFGVDIFKRENPQFIKSSFNNGTYNYFTADNKNFPTFFRLQHDSDRNNFWANDTLVYFEPWFTYARRQEDNTWLYEYDDLLELNFCTRDMFSEEFQYLIENIDIENYYCPQYNYTKQFGGYWDTNTVGYFNTFLQACNEGSKNPKGEDCATNEERLKNVNSLTFVFFYPKVVVDPNNYDKGIYYTLGSTTVFPDFYLIKKYEVFMRNSIMSSDYGWLISNNEDKSLLGFSHMTFDMETTGDHNKQNTYVKFNYYVTQDTDNYKRVYPKAQTLAAQVGGILKIIFLLGQILLDSYSFSSLLESVMNFSIKKIAIKSNEIVNNKDKDKIKVDSKYNQFEIPNKRNNSNNLILNYEGENIVNVNQDKPDVSKFSLIKESNIKDGIEKVLASNSLNNNSIMKLNKNYPSTIKIQDNGESKDELHLTFFEKILLSLQLRFCICSKN